MPITRENIEKKSFFYSILKPYVDSITKIYFRTKVHNFKNVPKNDIVIYAPNHQNALMDALAILGTLNTEPVFLARADIFKKKTIEKILTFLKILPIYRIRDGKESLGNNDAIFRKTIDVLKNKNGLVILPEGTHGDQRKLKTLKKGISRIVFEAEEANDFKLDIKIVPVGLDWSHYSNFGSRLFVNYGEPISTSEYYEAYKENPPRGMNLLRERVATELSKYMIDIRSDEYYETFDNIRYIYLPQMIDKMKLKHSEEANKFYAQKAIVDKLDAFEKTNPEETKELAEKTTKYLELLNKLNFKHWVPQKPKYSTIGIFFQSLLLILLSPVYLYGGIVNYLPYKIPVLVTKKIKDTQFISSIRHVVGMVLFPIYYIIIGVISLFIDVEWWFKLAFFVASPILGLFAFKYYIVAKKMFARLRYNIKIWLKNKDLIELKVCYEFICNKMDKITK